MDYSSRIQLKSNISQRFSLFAFSSVWKFLHLLVEYFPRENYIRHNFRGNFLHPGIISVVISRNNHKKIFCEIFSFRGNTGFRKIPWKMFLLLGDGSLIGENTVFQRRSVINDPERDSARNSERIRMREQRDFHSQGSFWNTSSGLTNHTRPFRRILHILIERSRSARLSLEARFASAASANESDN